MITLQLPYAGKCIIRSPFLSLSVSKCFSPCSTCNRSQETLCWNMVYGVHKHISVWISVPYQKLIHLCEIPLCNHVRHNECSSFLCSKLLQLQSLNSLGTWLMLLSPLKDGVIVAMEKKHKGAVACLRRDSCLDPIPRTGCNHNHYDSLN